MIGSARKAAAAGGATSVSTGTILTTSMTATAVSAKTLAIPRAMPVSTVAIKQVLGLAMAEALSARAGFIAGGNEAVTAESALDLDMRTAISFGTGTAIDSSAMRTAIGHKVGTATDRGIPSATEFAATAAMGPHVKIGIDLGTETIIGPVSRTVIPGGMNTAFSPNAQTVNGPDVRIAEVSKVKVLAHPEIVRLAEVIVQRETATSLLVMAADASRQPPAMDP